MLNRSRWNCQNSVSKSDFERITTFNFPAGRSLPEIAGSSLVRKKQPKKEKPNFEWARLLRGEAEEVELSTVEVDSDGDLTLKKVEPKKHTMSARSARKVRNKLHAMYRVGIAKTFVTLTMVADCPDRVAVRCLQKLLKLWRERWGQFNYLWVAERQENKRIHFHLVLDRFIDVQAENRRWAVVQYESGVIYSYEYNKNLVPVDPARMTPKQFAKIANPLDVEKIDSVKSLATYLASYVTKKIGEQFECQVWNCSKGVSALFTERMISTQHHEEAIIAMPGAPNVYVHKKDYYNKKGKLIHKAGDMVFPVDHSNERAAWVYFLNFNFPVWMDELDEVNRLVIEGKFNGENVCYYNYTEYAHRYQSLKYVGYKDYMQRYHHRNNCDAAYLKDITVRSIDPEIDFYQFGKAHRGRGLAAMYSDAPQFNYRKKRRYGDTDLTLEAINKLNSYINGTYNSTIEKAH